MFSVSVPIHLMVVDRQITPSRIFVLYGGRCAAYDLIIFSHPIWTLSGTRNFLSTTDTSASVVYRGGIRKFHGRFSIYA